jgi:hypothetical protein
MLNVVFLFLLFFAHYHSYKRKFPFQISGVHFIVVAVSNHLINYSATCMCVISIYCAISQNAKKHIFQESSVVVVELGDSHNNSEKPTCNNLRNEFLTCPRTKSNYLLFLSTRYYRRCHCRVITNECKKCP